jgi:nitrite reductase (NADH) large subunit
MKKTTDQAWLCTVCGYIHYGDAAPETCPICNAKAIDFKEVEMPVRPEIRDPGQERVVIIGAGIAGISAAEAVRTNAPSAEIILVAKEEAFPYYRINLTRLLAGEIAEKDLPLRKPDWQEEYRIDFRRGVAVSTLVLTEKAVQLDDGTFVQFDKLIVATGAHPFVPCIPGTDLDRVYTIHTVENARSILAAITPDSNVVCIGGGILGLESAGALAKQGCQVTVLEAFDYLMPRQLNPAGSDELNKHLQTLGIQVVTQAMCDCIVGDGHVTGVHLKRGQLIPADVVLLTAGDRSNTQLLQDAGLSVNKGVLVDNFLRTSHPDVYAVGDVAEHDGVLYGAWAPAMYQGKIAGMNAAGLPTEFGGIPRSHLLKVLGKPMLSIGTISPPDGSYHIIEDHPPKGYRMFMFRDGALAGCLLIGNLKLMKAVRKTIQTRTPLRKLLDEKPTAQQVADFLLGQ